MGDLRRYRKKPHTAVTAVRLDLDFDGFTYRKWGAEQRCAAGDWVVDNAGEVYTVDADSFADTYTEVAPGRYLKKAPVWAEKAGSSGTIATREGSTEYAAGDWLVYNRPERRDGYAVAAEEFERMYEPVPEDD